MTDLTFADSPVPTVTRTGAVNPFADVVAALAATMTDGKSPTAKTFIVPIPDVDKSKRQLSNAGNALNPSVTVRVAVETNTEQNVAAVTFWTVDKIVRAPKES